MSLPRSTRAKSPTVGSVAFDQFCKDLDVKNNTEIGARFGVSASTISGVRIAAHRPSRTLMRIIATECGIPMEDWDKPCEVALVVADPVKEALRLIARSLGYVI